MISSELLLLAVPVALIALKLAVLAVAAVLASKTILQPNDHLTPAPIASRRRPSGTRGDLA